MTFTIELPKAQYSEYVIRSALYWFQGPHELEDSGTLWTIKLRKTTPESQQSLNQLLNDYRLREILSEQAGRSDPLET